jgi:hypothetical protein
MSAIAEAPVTPATIATKYGPIEIVAVGPDRIRVNVGEGAPVRLYGVDYTGYGVWTFGTMRNRWTPDPDAPEDWDVHTIETATVHVEGLGTVSTLVRSYYDNARFRRTKESEKQQGRGYVDQDMTGKTLATWLACLTAHVKTWAAANRAELLKAAINTAADTAERANRDYQAAAAAALAAHETYLSALVALSDARQAFTDYTPEPAATVAPEPARAGDEDPYGPLDRASVIKRIREALQRRTGRTWSVTGGKGTAYGWLTIDAPPARRTFGSDGTTPSTSEWGSMSADDRETLYTALGLDVPSYSTNVSVPSSNDYYREYIDRAEGRPVAKQAESYWD